MKLSEYDRKYVLVRDIYGETFSGLANYAGCEFLECEYGGDEDGIFIDDFLIYNSQIESIIETEVHGTVTLLTENLVLRRYLPEDEHSYSWVMDVDGIVVGTIGAYDYDGEKIEVGFSVCRRWQGRGFATEALKKVLEYLLGNEGIPCVTAWCAEENTASRKVLEKAGMRLVRTEKAGLKVGSRVYDKLIYEVKAGNN